MRSLCLGSGNAWPLNEIAADRYAQERLKAIADTPTGQRPKDRRYRSSLYVEMGGQRILIDCGPDFAHQRLEFGVKAIDALLLTHDHFDHTAGLFDLEVFKRASDAWRPLPVFAHPKTFETLIPRLGYLFGGLLERRDTQPFTEVRLGELTVRTFKTYHGPFAPGSVGYVLQDATRKLVYTSDFSHVVENEQAITDGGRPDVLVIEANWFNEPAQNTSGHMSFQRAMPLIRRWDPEQVYLIHFGDEDLDQQAMDPLPHDIPLTHDQWNRAVRQAFAADETLVRFTRQDDIVAFDGLEIKA